MLWNESLVELFAETTNQDFTLIELETEGGILARYNRYKQIQEILSYGMENLGYECYITKCHRSPIIITFCYPNFKDFTFKSIYEYLKFNGFVIYPGKLSGANTFRIGNIGDLRVLWFCLGSGSFLSPIVCLLIA